MRLARFICATFSHKGHVIADKIRIEIRNKGSSDVPLLTVVPHKGKDCKIEEETGHPHQDEGPTAPVLA